MIQEKQILPLVLRQSLLVTHQICSFTLPCVAINISTFEQTLNSLTAALSLSSHFFFSLCMCGVKRLLVSVSMAGTFYTWHLLKLFAVHFDAQHLVDSLWQLANAFQHFALIWHKGWCEYLWFSPLPLSLYRPYKMQILRCELGVPKGLCLRYNNFFFCSGCLVMNFVSSRYLQHACATWLWGRSHGNNS